MLGARGGFLELIVRTTTHTGKVSRYRGGTHWLFFDTPDPDIILQTLPSLSSAALLSLSRLAKGVDAGEALLGIQIQGAQLRSAAGPCRVVLSGEGNT